MPKPHHAGALGATRPQDDFLAQQVYQQLRDEILSGGYGPGDRLVQVTIAEALDVSRTPVRDALLRLAQDGLIVAGGRGYTVVQMTHRDIVDIYEIRLALEVPAAELALDHLAPYDLERMRGLNARIAAGDKASAEYFDLNRDFHLVLARACPNRLIRKTLTDVWAMSVSRRLFQFEMDADVLDVSEMAREHDQIVAAVEARNRQQLRRLLTEHLTVSLRQVEAAEQRRGRP